VQITVQSELTCYRCASAVLPAVHTDTGGLCRKCQKSIPPRVELRDLVACMRGNDTRYRGLYFDQFSKFKPPMEALPILREAVLQDDHYLVRCAATSLQKLKAKAAPAIDDLLTAAARLDPMGMPQSYPECLAALVAIDKAHVGLVPLIRQFKHLDNWVPISASLKALAAIGTPEAVALLEEIHALWYPQMDKTQKRVADTILSQARDQLRDEQVAPAPRDAVR
jgi:hypothetical protein